MSEHPLPEPHRSIEEIAEGVFWVQGSVKMGTGIRISRNMVVVRSGDELTLISAVRLSTEGEAALEKLGKVKHVVKIGAFHGRDDAYSVSRFGAAYWNAGEARPEEPKPDHQLSAGALPIEDAELFLFEKTARRKRRWWFGARGGS